MCKIEWRPVPGFSRYEVCKSGILRSRKTKKLLRYLFSNTGYIKYHVKRDNDTNTSLFSHKAIALAFKENPNNYKYAQHLDGDKYHNHVDNIAWCTARENKRNDCKLKECDISMIFEYATQNMTYADIGSIFNVSNVTISNVLNRRSWSDVIVDSILIDTFKKNKHKPGRRKINKIKKG